MAETEIKKINGRTVCDQTARDSIPKSASDIGADPAGTGASKVTAHNISLTAHADIRVQLQNIADQLNAFLNVDDETRNELSEVLDLIDANEELIASITTNKVNVKDIIDNLTTNVSNKPLSAAQGVALKKLIDELQTVINNMPTSERFEQLSKEIVDLKASQSQIEPPKIVSSVDEMTDPTKQYVLDGYIYQWGKTTEEIVIPGETITTPAKAVIIKGYRYSHSGGAFQAKSTEAAVVFPIEITKTTTATSPVDFVLTNMKGSLNYSALYHGSTNTKFEGNSAERVSVNNSVTNFKVHGHPVGKWFVVFFVQYTGTETFDNASFTYDGTTFTSDQIEVYDDPTKASLAAFGTTTTTEGTTEIIETEGFYNTGLPYNSTDYGDRVEALENAVEVISAKSLYKSKYIAIDNNKQSLTSSVSMTVPQLKKNKTIAFAGVYTGSLSEISIVQGEGTGFTEVKCVVNATSITISKDGATVYTAEHGLTFGSYFSIVLATKNANKTKAYLSSGGETFTSAEFLWATSRKGLKLYTNVPFTQYQFSFGSNDFDKKLWLFGDSYFDHWLPLSIGRGYTNCLADGYSGGSSSAGASSFDLAIEHGTPSKVVWCLGMNDGDSADINQNWLTAITHVKEVCDQYDIELWVTTIPNVPSKNHTYKNAYIRQNFNYIDLAKYLGADEGTTWYTGLLSSDNVHPSTEGDFYIANIMENYLPEMLEV